MKFERIHNELAGIPYMTPQQGRTIYEFVLRNRPLTCLELGHAHGVSSCYIAAALEETGGTLVTVDLLSSRDLQPNIESLLNNTGLAPKVEVHREINSYTWFLKKEIEANTVDGICHPKYDFCYIDGAKNWTIDGFAFFLTDKLLKEDGWILFDDYAWSFAFTGREECDGITARNMGADEIKQAHVERIFNLLVLQHPNYSEFKIQDNSWAWAHKVRSDRAKLSIEATYSIGDLVKVGAKRVGRALLRRLPSQEN